MKVNCISVEHLIHLLRYDRKGGEDQSMESTLKMKGMNRSATSQSVDKLENPKFYKDDIVSRYTL